MNFKQHFNYAIDAIIEGFKRPCKVTYRPVEYQECSCVNIPPAKRGPAPFPGGNLGGYTGACPTCGGDGKIPVENTEEICMIVIFDFKQFYKINPTLDYADGVVQTLCGINLIQKLKNADYIYFNTDIENYQQQKYERVGEPQPIGLGADSYILVDWKRR